MVLNVSMNEIWRILESLSVHGGFMWLRACRDSVNHHFKGPCTSAPQGAYVINVAIQQNPADHNSFPSVFQCRAADINDFLTILDN